MNNRIIFLLFIFLITNCGGSDDNEAESNFDIEIFYPETASIDELVQLTIVGNEDFSKVDVSLDEDFENTAGTFFNSDVNTVTRYFNFDELGLNTIYVRGRNEDYVERVKTMNINILRGEAIKINSVEVVSFLNINETWDDEFNESEIDRLADVTFSLQKPKVYYSDDESFSYRNWLRSEIKENQGDLTWDTTDKSLYINPLRPFKFGLSDSDGEGYGQSLILGPPFSKTISFTDFIDSQPQTITYSDAEIDLEVIFTIDWPN